MPSRRRASLITLTTDIGSAYAAQMKAVLSQYVPLSRVVDLTHELAPHRIDEASFLLQAMARGFPPGTIHVVVVDPGVGGGRKSLGIECKEGSILIGPDNGVLMPLARQLGVRRSVAFEANRIRKGDRVGTTFDGRDLFAPAAGRLARGDPLDRLGHPVRPRSNELPVARTRGSTVFGQILHVDRFGNIITNVPTRWIPTSTTKIRIRVGRRPARSIPWVTNYETLGRGKLGGLGSSFGMVELSVAEGNASRRLRAKVGGSVELSIPQGKFLSRAGLAQ